MVHQRSPEAQKRREQKRAAREYVFSLSYNDYILGEKVCRTEPEQVQAFLAALFEYVDVCAVPCVFRGVVLSDGYGRGAFQSV